MAPMTKGSNLPYRRLCVELGARITMSEMTVARRLKQRRRGRVRADPAGRRTSRSSACSWPAPTPRRWAWAAGAGRIARRRSGRRQLRLPDRPLHPQGAGRVDRPAAGAHPPHRRGDEARRRSACRSPRRSASAGTTTTATTSIRRGPRWTAAPTPSPCTAARATPAIGWPPTGTPSARSWRPCRCRSSATATCSFRTRSTRRGRGRGARR